VQLPPPIVIQTLPPTLPLAYYFAIFLVFYVAGHLADRFDKAYLIRRIKFAEIILMLIGCFSLWQAI
jgi:MFS family permease